VYKPGVNLGVAGSWNNIITSNPDAPWWMIVGYDIVLAKGDMARLASHMETVGGIGMLGTFSAFGIDRGAVDRAGLFDENFHPAYYEDNDYDYRCRLKGVPMCGLPFGGRHKISSTIYSDNNRYLHENQRTFVSNHYYFLAKWGGEPYQEAYTTPFNKGGDPASWSLIEGRVAEQTWR
jgi:hypothetical protein